MKSPARETRDTHEDRRRDAEIRNEYSKLQYWRAFPVIFVLYAAPAQVFFNLLGHARQSWRYKGPSPIKQSDASSHAREP